MDRMISDQRTIEISWNGPFSWPKFEHENSLPPIPSHSGVYLWTVEYNNGYLIYAAGLTRRTFPTRLREHTRKYLKGDYTVLDIDAMQQGVRREIWHGWGWTPAKQAKFEERKLVICEAVFRQLAGFRIFVTDLGTQPRILERLEASIMGTLYKQPSPFCNIPDKGMFLAPRWDSESPIVVNNKSVVMLFGLPSRIEI